MSPAGTESKKQKSRKSYKHIIPDGIKNQLNQLDESMSRRDKMFVEKQK